MVRYGLWRALFMTFYSKDLYRDVLVNWSGLRVTAYLLFLLTLCWLPILIEMEIAFPAKYAQFSAKFVPQIPLMTIKNGVLVTPEDRPYRVIDPDSKEEIAIVDTSGTHTNFDNTKAYIVVTKKNWMTQEKNGDVKIHTWDETTNLTIHPEVISAYIAKYGFLLGIGFFIFALIGSFLYRMLQAMFYAVCGKIISKILENELKYGDILRLTMVSVTPAVLIKIACAYLFPTLSLWLIYFLIAMGYLTFAIKANKKIDKVAI